MVGLHTARTPQAGPAVSGLPALGERGRPGPLLRTGVGLATPPGLTRDAFESMGTLVECLIPEGRPEAAEAVRAVFAEWHRRLTRFEPESELSRLNANAGREVEVSPFLFGVVEIALRGAAATGGLFDPTLLHALEALGYDRSFELVVPDAPWPEPAALLRAPRRAGWQAIQLDATRRTIRLPQGAGIDLGGIAKGMAVDAAMDAVGRLGAFPAGVNAGGDLAVAGLPPSATGWPIAVELPPLPHASDGTEGRSVTLYGGALATSGVSRRSWRRAGRRLHHLLDPRTGLPAHNGLWSVSVAAPRCEQAEVAAKAAFVLGPASGARFLERWELPGLFVLETGEQLEAGPWRRPEGAGGGRERGRER